MREKRMALATPILAEQKIPALIVAHLVARRADADYPTPAADDLTLVAGPVKETTKRTHPSLEVWVESFEFTALRDVEEATVYLDLHADTAATLATELAQLALIRRAFAGWPTPNQGNATNTSTNPFMAYLKSLTNDEKAGWEITNFYISRGSILIEDDRRVIYRTEARCTCRTFTFTV